MSTRSVVGSDLSLLDGVPIVREAFPRTVRLVSTARLRDPVLRGLVDDADDLDELAEIEGATSARLVAEERGWEELPAGELVHGVPHARFINASFVYAKPREPNRFNSADRGAWYAALAGGTCIAEVGYHMTKFLADAGDFNASVSCAEMFSSMSGEFVDLRTRRDHQSLDAEPTTGYPAGNALAEATRGRGLNGIIYPSVRDPNGTCLVALWPHVVQSVAQGAVWHFVWVGRPEATVSAESENTLNS